MRRLCFLLPLALLSCSRPVDPGERFYVSDERGGTVIEVDPRGGRLVRIIRVGKRPRGLSLSPDRATLYVAVSGSPIGGPGGDQHLPPPDHGADGIAAIDLRSGKVERVLSAGTDPETFALSPDGRTLFVSNEDEGAVSAISVDRGRTTLSTKVGDEPEGVAVTQDGARLFVACEASDYVAMLDARTLKPLKTIPIEGRPRSLLLSWDGTTVYVSVESAGKLAILSAADGAIVKQIDLAHGDKSIKPMGMVEAADRHLFVTTGRAGILMEIDPTAGTILRSIRDIGARPWGIGITRDNVFLATANGPSGDITLIKRTSLKAVRKIKVGKAPWGIAGSGGGGAQ